MDANHISSEYLKWDLMAMNFGWIQNFFSFFYEKQPDNRIKPLYSHGSAVESLERDKTEKYELMSVGLCNDCKGFSTKHVDFVWLWISFLK